MDEEGEEARVPIESNEDGVRSCRPKPMLSNWSELLYILSDISSRVAGGGKLSRGARDNTKPKQKNRSRGTDQGKDS